MQVTKGKNGHIVVDLSAPDASALRAVLGAYHLAAVDESAASLFWMLIEAGVNLDEDAYKAARADMRRRFQIPNG